MEPHAWCSTRTRRPTLPVFAHFGCFSARVESGTVTAKGLVRQVFGQRGQQFATLKHGPPGIQLPQAPYIRRVEELLGGECKTVAAVRW
jgi:hypothetical protein